MDNADADWVAADGLEPSQWLETRRGQPEDPGVRRLIREVLADAIRLSQWHGCADTLRHGRARKLHAEALAWLASEGTQPFSFRWCCDALGDDGWSAEAIRAQLKVAGVVIPREHRFTHRVVGRLREPHKHARVRQGGRYRAGAEF
jgi:hypothetical protein